MRAPQLRTPHCFTLVDLMVTLVIIKVLPSLTATPPYFMDGQEPCFTENHPLNFWEKRYYGLIRQFR